MKDLNYLKNNSGLPKFLVSLSIITFCVIVGGLFFNSHEVEVNKQFREAQTGMKEFYYAAPSLPEKLDFAGEPVPLENFDIREALDRELLSISYFHSQAFLYLKKTNRYYSVIEPILKKNGIPGDFKYLAMAESGFLDKVISPAGAVGLWQFMKSAAKEYGLEVNEEVDERYHIEKATEAACKYLKNSYSKYGNWTMVAASFNAGMGGMNKQIDAQDSKNYYDLLLNEETSRYLFRILALKLVISNPEKYGFKLSDEEKYPIIPVTEVKVTGSINSFADFARNNSINYKMLKQFNPWLRQSYLKNPMNKTYTVKIPEVGKYRKYVFTENADLQ